MSLTVTDILKFRESESDPWQRLLLQANINFNLIYPVGSIYMSTVNVDPATLFGGTWERLEDRFLLGAGSTYTAGDTGGSATMAHTHSTGNHTLTVSEIPSHTHGAQGWRYGHGEKQDNYCMAYTRLTGDAASTSTPILATGGGKAHNHGNTGAASNDDNMPPYIVVYMWKRLTLSPSLTPLPMNVLGDVASEDIVPISKGGTGATTAADARENLGINDLIVIETVGISFSNGLAVVAAKTGYYLASAYTVNRGTSEPNTYAIANIYGRTDGTYQLQNKDTTLSASLFARLTWVKSN
jgi:hypothetical protein